VSKDKKKVLITGISSFVGANLAIQLSNQGYQVIGLVSKPTQLYAYPRNLRLNICERNGVKILRVDLSHKDEIINCIHENKPNFFIHHAAWVKNANSFKFDLSEAIKINLLPLRTIYEELVKCSASGIIITGTNAEYGEKNSAFLESDACFPTTPYGLSKLSQTITAFQLFREFNLPTRISRIFNPLGALDNPQKLLPSIINEINQNKSFNLSKCSQKRDFIFIGDLVIGYQKLIEDLNREGFDIFNICSGNAISVKDILTLITLEMGKDLSLLNFGAIPMRPGEPEISYGSNKKALELLGWRPEPVEEKISLIVEQILTDYNIENT